MFNRIQRALLLWILFLTYVSRLSLLYCLVGYLKPCDTCWERVDSLALLCVMILCVFVTFLYGVLSQVWYLIVSIPDLCRLLYFHLKTYLALSLEYLEIHFSRESLPDLSINILYLFLTSVSVPETWAHFSNNNIQRSQSERAASKNMRNEIESCLNACANEMWQQWNSVNVALTQRMQDSTDTRNKLQTHLSRVSK